MKLPRDFEELSIWLSPDVLKAFDKTDVLVKGVKSFRDHADQIDRTLLQKLSAGLTIHDRGLFTLRLYFYQLFHREKICLDLREKHFQYRDYWIYSGQSYAYQFSSEFLIALQKTYRCFYLENAAGLDQCLRELGMIQAHWSDRQIEELSELFINHFKGGEKQLFKLKSLLSSFQDIFYFIIKNKGKVKTDFALFGIYLTTLYLNLDNIDDELDVRSSFDFISKSM